MTGFTLTWSDVTRLSILATPAPVKLALRWTLQCVYRKLVTAA